MSSENVVTTGEVTLKKGAVTNVWWAAGFGASLMSPAMCLGGIMALQAGVCGHVMALPVMIGMIFCLLWGVSYYRMATKLPKCGSHYAYVYSQFGVWPAWFVWATVACVYLTPIPPMMILHMYISSVWPWVPLWLVLLIGEIFVTGLSIRGIRLASGTAFGLYMIETAIILALSGALLVRFIGTVPDLGSKIVAAYNPSFSTPDIAAVGIGAIMTASLLVTWNFLGFCSITTLAEESKPGLVGIGVVLAILMIGATYLIGTTIIPILWWDDIGMLAASADPLTEAARVGFGALWPLVLVAITLSCITCSLATQNSGPRVFVDMARDGVLPRVFGAIHKKYQTPWLMLVVVAIIVGGGALLLTAIMGFLKGLIIWVSMQAVLFLIAYILVALANIKAFWNDNSLSSVFLSKVLPILSIIAAAYLIVNSGAEVLIWSAGFVGFWVIIGIILWIYRRQQMRQLRLDEI